MLYFYAVLQDLHRLEKKLEKEEQSRKVLENKTCHINVLKIGYEKNLNFTVLEDLTVEFCLKKKFLDENWHIKTMSDMQD